MKVEVSYLVRKEVEVELTETLFRELYNKFKNSALTRSLIADAIYLHLAWESGCVGADGEDIDYDFDVESWVDEMYEKMVDEEY